jgi:hypothetical protein
VRRSDNQWNHIAQPAKKHLIPVLEGSRIRTIRCLFVVSTAGCQDVRVDGEALHKRNASRLLRSVLVEGIRYQLQDQPELPDEWGMVHLDLQYWYNNLAPSIGEISPRPNISD